MSQPWKQFISQWSIEEMPACPDGMELRHFVSLKYPGAYGGRGQCGHETPNRV
jgi:hypothetical protein